LGLVQCPDAHYHTKQQIHVWSDEYFERKEMNK